MKTITAFAIALILTGCDRPEYATNQTLRTEIFFRCLQSLPAGPVETKYNDWAEVVNECETAAYHQARYCVRDCKTSTYGDEVDQEREG